MQGIQYEYLKIMLKESHKASGNKNKNFYNDLHKNLIFHEILIEQYFEKTRMSEEFGYKNQLENNPLIKKNLIEANSSLEKIISSKAIDNCIEKNKSVLNDEYALPKIVAAYMKFSSINTILKSKICSNDVSLFMEVSKLYNQKSSGLDSGQKKTIEEYTNILGDQLANTNTPLSNNDYHSLLVIRKFLIENNDHGGAKELGKKLPQKNKEKEGPLRS